MTKMAGDNFSDWDWRSISVKVSLSEKTLTKSW